MPARTCRSRCAPAPNATTYWTSRWARRVAESFAQDRLTFLYDFPASQAALAQVRGEVASRFEAFWGPLELANGFHELGSAPEQRARFEADIARRSMQGQPVRDADALFLDALAAGLPPCAGVALGFDRLVMVASGASGSTRSSPSRTSGPEPATTLGSLRDACRERRSRPVQAGAYDELDTSLGALLAGENHLVACAANMSSLLNWSLPDLNWVGFYLRRRRSGDLIVGPFQGKPACVRIPLGEGRVRHGGPATPHAGGTDVHEFPGHIACDSASNSEVVVPIIAGGRLLGVLDLDSPLLNRFDERMREGWSGWWPYSSRELRVDGLLRVRLAAGPRSVPCGRGRQ